MHVYEPSEDSFLFRDCLPDDMSGVVVVEIGPGSGIISVAAAKRQAVVTAIDKNPDAVKATKELAKEEQVAITVLEGDLFSPIDDKMFDCILCNPPYLPNEPNDPDIALDGGPEGWEFIERFLKEAVTHLKEDGSIFLVFTSYTKPDKVAECINKQNLVSKLLAKKELGFFEELFIVELKREEQTNWYGKVLV